MTDQITPAAVPVRNPVERVTLTRQEAAVALGVSVDHFERHIQPGLHRWADRKAARTLDGGPG